MKLLIASDIHGSALFCRRLLDRVEAEMPDKLLLLGDLLYHGPRNDLPEGYRPKEVITMLSGLKDHILAVRGNCEAEVDQMVLPFPAWRTTLCFSRSQTSPSTPPMAICGIRTTCRPWLREPSSCLATPISKPSARSIKFWL